MTLPEGVPPGAVSTDVQQVARMWGGGFGRFFFPGFWLVYLGSTISWIANHEVGWRLVLGEVIVGAFAICYLVTLQLAWSSRTRLFWGLYGTAIGLTAIEMYFAHQSALGFFVYIAVLTSASRTRWTIPLIGAMVVLTGLLPLIRSWGGAVDWNTALTVGLVSIAMIGFFKIIESNIALAAARAEVARLAAENERSRIARDLHDLLGHSLTAITIKAGLARRLAERGEDSRALTEIAEVETLSRRTLADVRAAVAGHNDVTITGELATAREVLRASGIISELPGSVDIVDPRLSEVLGWALREGVTNVVRHARATHCVITLGPRWLEIADDGVGATAHAACGSGLAGLRDRLAAYGGTVEAGTVEAGRHGSGWRLRAEVPAVAVATGPAVELDPEHLPAPT